ncbi:MAG TPA: hypothetical protein VFA04_04335 [Bryobacteraceae bacterium]|nr:hypothetical protein [Bryobacteraceae bacterium]
MPEDKGTGKHPHKSTEEPFPHHRGKQETSSQESGGGSSGNRGEGESLRDREYRDSKGNEHHHTRTYEKQHDK